MYDDRIYTAPPPAQAQDNHHYATMLDRLRGIYDALVGSAKQVGIIFKPAEMRAGHASALIASGLDVLTVSRRLGHGSRRDLENVRPPVQKTDLAAASAIEAALRMPRER